MKNHINIDDEGIVIEYIQSFLKEHYDSNIVLSGIYDSITHNSLIAYLKQPNTASHTFVKKQIMTTFTYREIDPPNAIIDGGGMFNFDSESTLDQIVFYTKPTKAFYNNGTEFIFKHLSEVDSYVSQFGWKVTESNMNYSKEPNNGRTVARFVVRKTGITNILPNSDVLPMVNLSDGSFLSNRSFLLDDGWEGILQDTPYYKLSVIPCNPGDTFTIAHGFPTSTEIAVSCIKATLDQIRNEDHEVYNVYSRLNNSRLGSLNPGDFFIYEIPKTIDCNYLLVQIPEYHFGQQHVFEKTIKLGDINSDGVVDSVDVQLLESWIESKESGRPEPFTLSLDAKIAANVSRNVDLEGNPIVTRDDLVILRNAVESHTQDSLGYYKAYKDIDSSVTSYSNQLLVMFGEDALDDSKNIPVKEFWKSPWSVHYKFIEYILGRVIHPYSYMRDICWLQENSKFLGYNMTPALMGTYDNDSNYLTADRIIFDEFSGKYKYVRGPIYTGYYVWDQSQIFNGEFRSENENKNKITTIEGRIYINGIYDGRVILQNFLVVEDAYNRSLRAVIKEFQDSINKSILSRGSSSESLIKWCIGYLDVETELHFVQSCGDELKNIVGAFK